jgi:hypothetical protein
MILGGPGREEEIVAINVSSQVKKLFFSLLAYKWSMVALSPVTGNCIANSRCIRSYQALTSEVTGHSGSLYAICSDLTPDTENVDDEEGRTHRGWPTRHLQYIYNRESIM